MRFLSLVVFVAALLACANPSGGPPAAPAPEPAAPAPSAPVAGGEIPLYSATPLDRAELERMSLRELSLRRNTIFARVGNPFNKKWLHDYFAAQPWYEAKPRAELEKLSEVDRQNAALIGEVEASVPRDRLRKELERLRASGSLSADERVELELVSAALGEYAGDAAVPVAERDPLEDPTVLDRKLTPAQIADLSRRDLRLVRNTIFARHGREFRSPVLTMWFTMKEWYDPDPSYTDAALTEVDRANIALITAREEELGGALTDEDQEFEELGAGLFAA